MPRKLSRAELLADLSTGIGGSECHHLFNLEPYGCRRQLWYTKTGAKPDFEFRGNRDTERGSAMEDLICDLFRQQTKRRLKRHRMFSNHQLPWWICHPDRLIVGRPNGDAMARRGKGILEAKCPSMRTFLRIRREGLNDAWILQLQHSLGASGLRWGSYAIFSAEMWELVHFDMTRDDAIIDTIKKQVASFWPLVQNGPAPDRLPATDPRCRSCPFRTQCQGQALIDAIVADEGGTGGWDLPKDPGLSEMAKAVHEARQIVKEAKEAEEIAAKRLVEAMGNRAGVEAGEFRVYCRVVETNRIDSQLLRKELPDIAAKYDRPSVSRPLKVFSTLEKSDGQR